MDHRVCCKNVYIEVSRIAIAIDHNTFYQIIYLLTAFNSSKRNTNPQEKKYLDI